MPIVHVGGSFAPPLTDADLSAYKSILATLPNPSPLRDMFSVCLNAVNRWWFLPESSGDTKGKHAMGFPVVELDGSIKTELFDHLPWDHELAAFKSALNEIENTEVRNAFAHLLWYTVELCNDREPVTMDKI